MNKQFGEIDLSFFFLERKLIKRITFILRLEIKLVSFEINYCEIKKNKLSFIKITKKPLKYFSSNELIF